MFDEVLKSLAHAGPVALVLGYCLWTVWSAKKDSEKKCAAEIAAARADFADQVAALRAEFVLQIKAERDRSDAALRDERDRHEAEEKELRGELVTALHAVANAMKG